MSRPGSTAPEPAVISTECSLPTVHRPGRARRAAPVRQRAAGPPAPGHGRAGHAAARPRAPRTPTPPRASRSARRRSPVPSRRRCWAASSTGRAQPGCSCAARSAYAAALTALVVAAQLKADALVLVLASGWPERCCRRWRPRARTPARRLRRRGRARPGLRARVRGAGAHLDRRAGDRGSRGRVLLAGGRARAHRRRVRARVQAVRARPLVRAPVPAERATPSVSGAGQPRRCAPCWCRSR